MTALGANFDPAILQELQAYIASAQQPLFARRTVFKSPIIPLDDYMKLHFLESWNRWPQILTQIDNEVPAEELGERLRRPGQGLSACHVFSMCSMYGARKLWAALGVEFSDEDAHHRRAVVYDFWRRASSSWRGDGFLGTFAAGNTARPCPPDAVREIADGARPVAGAEDIQAWQRRLSQLMQYALLLQLEVRFGFGDSGPYPLPRGRVMLIREYFALADSWIPWTPRLAEMPDNDLVIGLVFRPGLQLNVNDIATATSVPADMFQFLEAVAAFRSDGRGNLTSLTDDELRRNEEGAKAATIAFYRDLATWTHEQKVIAGAFPHFCMIRPFALAAGIDGSIDWSLPGDATRERLPQLPDIPVMLDHLGDVKEITETPESVA